MWSLRCTHVARALHDRIRNTSNESRRKLREGREKCGRKSPPPEMDNSCFFSTFLVRFLVFRPPCAPFFFALFSYKKDTRIYIYIFLSEYYSVLQIIFLFLYHADTIYEHEGASRQKISNSATIKAGGKTAGTRRTRALRQGFVSPPQCISYWTIALGSSFK